MGTRLLAILAVTALGAGSAFVGMSMASAGWNVVGTGLAPGEGWALQLDDGSDRLRLELANATTDPVATFSVYGPDGARVGYYALNADTRAAEIAAGSGTWLVFVYKAQGADLTLSFHGQADKGRVLPAEVERRETLLSHSQQSAPVDATFTAMLKEEPVLAGVYLKGSARNLQSELFTEKGIVEVVSEAETSAAGGVIVDSEGKRATLPQNLQAGAFTAKVKADSLSGSLLLVSLHMEAPLFAPAPAPAPAEAEEAPPPPPGKPHGHKAHKSHVAVAEDSGWVECGTIASHVPTAVMVPKAAPMRLTLVEEVDPWVTVFDPYDGIAGFVELKEEGQQEVLPLAMSGEFVLYARGADVLVELLGVDACPMRELPTKWVAVASVEGGLDGEGSGILGIPVPVGGTQAAANFSLGLAPLEYGARISADTIAQGLELTFVGPAGEAAQVRTGFAVGLFGDTSGYNGHNAVDPTMMLAGEWVVEAEANLLQGSVEALALHYLREAPEDDEDAEDEDDGA